MWGCLAAGVTARCVAADGIESPLPQIQALGLLHAGRLEYGRAAALRALYCDFAFTALEASGPQSLLSRNANMRTSSCLRSANVSFPK